MIPHNYKRWGYFYDIKTFTLKRHKNYNKTKFTKIKLKLPKKVLSSKFNYKER